jgi:VWFA-related protein
LDQIGNLLQAMSIVKMQTSVHLSRREFGISAASFLYTATGLRAQDDATFKAGIKVVNVLATVRTKKGEIIRNLEKDDFSLAENGHPQTIRYFARQSDLPITIGLMVDTSMSQRRVMESERAASFRFLEQVLRDATDQVFIMQFDMAMIMRQKLTSSFKQLNDALAYVDTPDRQELSIPTSKGTVLYDAVVKASKEVMREQHGRKALILLTDGVDVGSDASLMDAIEAAQRADTLVYSILFSDPGAYGFLGGGENGAGALKRISRDTGAGFFEVSKKHGIDQMFDAIQDELRSQYSIGYVSGEPVRISEWRSIQLTAKPRGLVVQARERYWAQR